MTDALETPPPAPSPGPPTDAFSDERQMALIIYILYLVSLANGITAIIGLVLAYVSRDTAPDWLKSHYTFQIRTFWIGMLFFVVAIPLCFIVIGIPLVMAATIWFVVRCAVGLSRLLRKEAYPTPLSWII